MQFNVQSTVVSPNRRKGTSLHYFRLCLFLVCYQTLKRSPIHTVWDGVERGRGEETHYSHYTNAASIRSVAVVQCMPQAIFLFPPQ